MGIRKFKPTAPGRRGSNVADFVEIARTTPEKSLVKPLSKSGGRNASGRITTRHRWWPQACLPRHRLPSPRQGRRARRRSRTSSTTRNRTARIALLHYADGEAPSRAEQAAPGRPDRERPRGRHQARQPAAAQHPLPVRSSTPWEIKPGGGAKIARSAGVRRAARREGRPYAQLRMPSGEIPQRGPALPRHHR